MAAVAAFSLVSAAFVLAGFSMPTFFFSPKSAFIDALDQSGISRETYAAGVSWSDYDNDGLLDLFVAARPAKLYRNDGNGRFRDVTANLGVAFNSAAAGIFGDYDNDGCRDLFVVGAGKGPDSLYHNDCDGTFTDVTDSAGAIGIDQDGYRGAGAAWADYDNDGDLDLYLVNHGVFTPENEYIFEPNILYRNNGNGTFTDVTEEAGVSGITNCGLPPRKIPARIKGILSGPLKLAFQPQWFDYDNDGDVDLFVATEETASPLYRNNGDGTFEEATKETGLCRYGSNMGVAAGDYDNDGDLDLYATNVGANYFWRNNGDATFTEVAAETGVAHPFLIGWGTLFLDYDNDGDLDLYVADGMVNPEFAPDPEVGQVKADRLYRNNGEGGFEEVGAREGVSLDFATQGLAAADYNNDGFLDMVVAPDFRVPEESHRLYQNQGNRNHWLTIELIGTKSNRDGVGARVYVTASGKTQMREIASGTSYLSQDSPWQTFGLGSARRADTVEIKWPSGTAQVLKDVPADQKIVVREE